MSKTAPIEYEVVAKTNRQDYWVVQPKDGRRTQAPKYEFGFSLFEVERTCSAREVGAAWSMPMPPEVRHVCAQFLVDRLTNRAEDVGCFIAFHHHPAVLELFEAAGFIEFCSYPGNEEEVVHGMRFIVRDEDWVDRYYGDDWGDDSPDF